MITEATCASVLTRTGPNTVPMKVIKHRKHTLAWQYEVYLGAEKSKLCWSVRCGCQHSQGKMCANKNANISLAVRDSCLTITHHPPQSFGIEIVYWPVTSAVCRQCGTGWPNHCPGAWLLQASRRCSKCPWCAPSVRTCRGTSSSLTPVSGCTEHFVFKKSLRCPSTSAFQNSCVVQNEYIPTAVHMGDRCWAREDSSPWGNHLPRLLYLPRTQQHAQQTKSTLH